MSYPPSSAHGIIRQQNLLNIDEPLAMLRSGATSYYEQDGLRSVTSLSDAAGALARPIRLSRMEIKPRRAAR